MTDSMQNSEQIILDAQRDFGACATVTELEQAKARYLGKTGLLTESLKGLGKLSAEERPAAGAAARMGPGASLCGSATGRGP